MHFFVFVSIIDYVLYVLKFFMKKIFIQIRQWILMHKKKIIYGALALLIFQIWFLNLGGIWIENEVFADDNWWNSASQNASYQEKAEQWYEKLSLLQKIIYVLIYPLLVVAWKLADNSFVYWEIFWFDAVLWQLWNIVRNLANFALGFIFIFYIFQYLIIQKKDYGPKRIIVRSLIAWIWIQASWFIMAVLVDVSTILAYWVWGLPVSILNENITSTDDESLKNNPYILKNVVYVDVKDIDTFHMYLTNTSTSGAQAWNYYISECKTFSYKNWAFSEELILSPKMIYYVDKKWTKPEVKLTDPNRCHFYGQVYYFSQPYVEKPSCSDVDDCLSKQITYEDEMMSAIGDITKQKEPEVVKYITEARILQIWDAHTTGGVLWFLWPVVYGDQKYGLDLYNKWTGSWWSTSRLQDILNWKSYVGVFTALYSSLLNSWRGVIPSDTGVFSALLKVALSLWHVIAIWIPLIVVALVFMMRIWILWMAIALSPMIILLTSFELDKEIGKEWLLSYFTIQKLIPVIFAPAIICFAISISTVLVDIISGLNLNGIDTVKQEILWWLIRLDVWWLAIDLWKLIISVIWIAVTRFLVWTAVWYTKLWESKFITSLKTLAETSLWSIPFIPIPSSKGWVEFIWANSAFGLNWKDGLITTATDKIKSEFDKKDQKAIEERINPEKAAKDAEITRENEMLNKYSSALTSLNVVDLGDDWTSKEIQWTTFNNLNDWQKKQVIEKINKISDKSLLNAFGDKSATKNIKIGSEEYEFIKDEWYKLKEKSTT